MSVNKKIGIVYHLFSFLNFPRATIFIFILFLFLYVTWLPVLLRIDVLLYATIGQPYDVKKVQK